MLRYCRSWELALAPPPRRRRSGGRCLVLCFLAARHSGTAAAGYRYGCARTPPFDRWQSAARCITSWRHSARDPAPSARRARTTRSHAHSRALYVTRDHRARPRVCSAERIRFGVFSVLLAWFYFARRQRGPERIDDRPVGVAAVRALFVRARGGRGGRRWWSRAE